MRVSKMSLQQYLALWRWESEHTFIKKHTNEPGLCKKNFVFHQIRRLPSYSRSPLIEKMQRTVFNWYSLPTDRIVQLEFSIIIQCFFRLIRISRMCCVHKCLSCITRSERAEPCLGAWLLASDRPMRVQLFTALIRSAEPEPEERLRQWRN